MIQRYGIYGTDDGGIDPQKDDDGEWLKFADIQQRQEFTGLDDAASAVDKLKGDLLFGAIGDGSEEIMPMARYAEQHFLQAIDHLSLAHRALKLAWMEQLENR